MNITLIILLISYVLEPLLWYYSTRDRFEVKNMKIVYVFVLVDIVDSLLQYTNLTQSWQALHSVFFFSYITSFICFCFRGNVKSKFKHAGTMILLYLASDLISMLVLSIFTTIDQISGSGIWNAFGTLLSRIVMFILIKLIIQKSVSISVEMVPFVFMMVLIEIPIVVLFKDSSSDKTVINIVLYSVAQVSAVCMVCWVNRLLARKNIDISNIKNRSELIETELENKTSMLNAAVIELEKLRCIENKTDDELEFTENRRKIHIKRNNILYVERSSRKIIIVEQDGQKHEINSSITKMIDLLGEQFDKISQGVIVNKNCVISIDSECVKLKGGIMLYASRRMQKCLKEGELV